MFQGNQWVSYDDLKMMRVKALYIMNEDYGGAMFWDMASDDFNNVCGEGKYPLISSVSSVVKDAGCHNQSRKL